MLIMRLKNYIMAVFLLNIVPLLSMERVITWKFISYNNEKQFNERNLSKEEIEKLNKVQSMLQESYSKLLNKTTDTAVEYVIEKKSTFDNYVLCIYDIKCLKSNLEIIDNMLKDNKTIFTKKDLCEYTLSFFG